ncbi:glycosyltransferase [Archaeoglobus neptunius]|uniref:glycosyltransferase n=1 Tax=Archaeoglobus neptunius TaxID=2798580 RepID=UPI0019279FBC|nr:glycosyltransferase [Archaeoglobus neptunius]
MISVIIPAYNEEKNIRDVLNVTAKTLDGIVGEWEIVLVDDGSKDLTLAIAKEFAALDGRIKVLSYGRNRGKGFALKYSFERSSGDLVAFMDADLDLHPKNLATLLEVMEKEKADVVVGSKRHPRSKINYPLKRRLMSDVYYLIVKILFNLNVRDTQVGLKLFRREVLRDIMPRLLVKRYAFDVELLANAVRRGYKIVEAPIELDYRSSSNINWAEIWRMFVDTLAVAYRMYLRGYYD